MKKTILFLTSLLLLTALHAQVATVRNTSMTETRITFTTPQTHVETIELQQGLYDMVTLKDFIPDGKVGAPTLPVYSRIIEIPLCSEVAVEINSAETVTLSGDQLGIAHPLLPQQPHYSKSDTGAHAWVVDADSYSADRFQGRELVEIQPLGIARDRNLALLTYSPLRYNAATGMVEYCHSADITLRYVDVDINATRQMKQRYHSEAFAPQCDLLFTLPAPKAATTSSTPVRYLIVCHSSFRGAMDTFIEWKRRKGFLTDIVYTGDAGVGTTAASIAAYVKSQYTNATDDNPAPTYLLLVGDVDQIPPFNANNSVDNDHITDLYYATWTDGDVLPDCYYGRFSAQNEGDLMPQISKTLMYEQYDFRYPSYLGKAVLIAGVDRGSENDNAYRYGDPAMDYVNAFYINATNGYTDVTYYKNNTSYAPSGVTVTGSSQSSNTTETLVTIYNEGVGLVNYTAHGSETSWSDPSLTTTNAGGLLNLGKPMFMIGNCCLSNHFNTGACLGEALLRRGNNAGAVAYIGASNSTYWYEDFCWTVGVRTQGNVSNGMTPAYDGNNLGSYDRLFHTHGEDGSMWNTTAGGMIYAGNMTVQTASVTYAPYYWEIYHVMGDPSLQPWLGEASVMPVTVSTTFPRNNAQMPVTAVPYAYIALTDGNGNIMAATFADAQGDAILSIPSTLPIGIYELALTAQNYQPAFLDVQVYSENGSGLTIRSFESDQPMVAGDTVTFTATIYNSTDNASGDADLVCESADMTLLRFIDDSIHVASVAAHDTLTLTAVFRAVVSAAAIDGSRVSISMHMVENGESTRFTTNQIIHASHLELSGYRINGSVTPNGTITVDATISNIGSTDAENISIELVHLYGLMTVNTTAYTQQTIAANGESTYSFSVTLASVLPESPNIPLQLRITRAGIVKTYPISVSYNSNIIVDFETGAADQVDFTMGNKPWIVDNTVSYHGDYSLRSAERLSNWASSQMQFTQNVLHDDSLRFYAKISTEANHDRLRVSIDGTVMLTLSGLVDWAYYAIPVSAGSHTFTFNYSKDYSRSSGSDAVWVDDIVIPNTSDNAVFRSDTVCLGSRYTFNGSPVSTDEEGVTIQVDQNSTPASYLCLTVLPVPEVTVSASDEIITAGTAVLLTATGADQYLWSTGESGNAIHVTPATTTEYQVTGLMGQCSATASITIEVTSAIDDVDNTLQAHIYPNPASSQVTVEAPAMQRLTLFDVAGRQLWQRSATTDTAVVPLHNIPQGIYLLQVESAIGVATYRITVR